jgi:predicted ATPase
MAETRKAIHAFLTPASHEAWHEFAAENGVSVSGLIEALALDWAARTDTAGAGGDDAFALDEVEALARQARRIDAQRRRRSR